MTGFLIDWCVEDPFMFELDPDLKEDLKEEVEEFRAAHSKLADQRVALRKALIDCADALARSYPKPGTAAHAALDRARLALDITQPPP
jgi:hypothetical protein